MLKRLDLHYECLAPEYFDDDQVVSSPADMWALGVLLYQWVHGYMPFKNKDQCLFKTIKNIVEESPLIQCD